MDKDYYAILGVHPSAEEAVISAAYRALAKLYHPDLYKGGDAADRMAKINEAYATLSDKEKRKEYDANRTNSLPEDDPIFDNTEYDDEEFFGEDWSLAMEYYPKAAKEAEKLAKISTKLAFAYKAYLIEKKDFKTHTEIFVKFRDDFLSSYFGDDKILIDLARQLIADGRRDVALELNKAVRVLGHSLNALTVIQKLEKKFNFKYNNSVDQQKTTKEEYDWVIWVFAIFCGFLILALLAS